MNPISRIVSSNLKSIDGVEKEILTHYPIFIPKKNEAEERKGSGRVIRKQATMNQ